MMPRKYSGVLSALIAIRRMEAMASGALLPFVVLWAHRNAGLVGPAAGALFVGQAIGEFGAGIVAGGLADRLGHRRILVVSTAGTAVSYGLLALAHAPILAIVLFLTSGIFESAFHPTVAALVGGTVAEDHLAHAFSLVRVGVNIGRVVGPLLGALAALESLSLVFALSSVLLTLGVLVELLMLPSDTGQGVHDMGDEPEIPPGTLRAIRQDRALAVLVLGGGLIAITYAWWESDGLVVIRTQTTLSATTYAALFSFAALVIVLGQLPITRALRNLRAGPTLLLGGLLQGAGLGVLAAAHWGLAVLVIAIVLMTFGEMVYSPTVSTLVTQLARPNQRASYQAALSITEDIGTAIGPISGLALARVITAAGLWGAGAILSALAGLTSSLARTKAPAQVLVPSTANP